MAKITIKNMDISIIKVNDNDYISLTDMLRAKDGDFFFSNWLRNRNTIEFLGIWERVFNPNFNYAEFDIIKLNQIAIQQMKVLEKVENQKLLK
jgi:hypothetical protein